VRDWLYDNDIIIIMIGGNPSKAEKPFNSAQLNSTLSSKRLSDFIELFNTVHCIRKLYYTV
ncbi:MAG: hypothetical protein ACI90V_006753, partial [Bacillariaceae sp.]|jgi:hypothetical protein